MPANAFPRPSRNEPVRLSDLVGIEAGTKDPLIRGVTLDSRAVRPGDLYAALPGARTHGARFADQAFTAGAVAIITDDEGKRICSAASGDHPVPVVVLADPRRALGDLAARIYGRPGESLLMFAVSGTNGKTTTCYLLDAGLRALGRTTGLLGTIETRVGGEALQSVRTTPEASDLQALLAVMVENAVNAVSLEVSSHALRLGRVDGAVFDISIFTNLSEDHLDFHADMEDYFQAKAELFSPARSRCAVIDVEDRWGQRVAEVALSSGLPVVRVSPTGRAAHADWCGSDIELKPLSSMFTLRGPNGVSVRASVGIAGRHNVHNAALAIAALATAGFDPQAAADGVATCAAVPGRMERVEAGQPFVAVVDYAHTPDSVEISLATLREITKGRLIAVMGCGGDRDPYKRPAMGEAAARGADLVVITDDNPRSENPAAIRAAIVQGAALGDAEKVEIGGRGAAIRYAVRAAGPGDTVAVLGRGHEAGQEVDGVVLPFDDRRELAEAIKSTHGREQRA